MISGSTQLSIFLLYASFRLNMIVARFQAPRSPTTNCIIEYYFDYCNKKSVPAVTVKNGQPATPQLIALLNTISIIAINSPFRRSL